MEATNLKIIRSFIIIISLIGNNITVAIKKDTICIIPARYGSKRIKKKNIKNFFGKPIIYYPIKESKKSKLFKNIYISTDSKLILNITKKFGATVPFLRDKKISDDKTGTEKVIKEFLKKIDNSKIENIFCIYPASPLIKSIDLKKAFKIFKKNKLDYLVTIAKFNSNPERSIILNKNSIKFKYPKNINKNSQEFKDQYFDTGNFYIYSNKYLLGKSKKNFKNGFYLLDQIRAVDINLIEDFEKAKKLFKIFN